MSILAGEYKHQLDAKNRIRIPARLRKELGDEYYFARGDHNCVYVLDVKEMGRIMESIQQTKLSDIDQNMKNRRFTRTITPVVEDGQGRIVLTPELRAHLKFQKNEKDIIVIGVGSRAEIWSKSNYEACLCGTDGEGDDFNSVIAALDF